MFAVFLLLVVGSNGFVASSRASTILLHAAAGDTIQVFTPGLQFVAATQFVAMPPQEVSGIGPISPSFFVLGQPTPPLSPQAYVDIYLADAPAAFTGLVGLHIHQHNGFQVATLNGAFSSTAADSFESIHFSAPLAGDVTFAIFTAVMQPGLSLQGLALVNQAPPNLADFDLVFGISKTSPDPIDPALPLIRMSINEVTLVPEPSTLALAAVGLIGAVLLRGRRRW
ncbi:MAG: PEP-CTERM sorting domain-containing protein [Pirellulales bacterium]